MITVTIIGIAVLFLIIQLILCFKTKKTIIKYVPMLVILCGLLFCFIIYMNIFGTNSSSVIAENQTFAIFLSIVLVPDLIGVLLGWLIFGFIKKKYISKS